MVGTFYWEYHEMRHYRQFCTHYNEKVLAELESEAQKAPQEG